MISLSVYAALLPSVIGTGVPTESLSASSCGDCGCDDVTGGCCEWTATGNVCRAWQPTQHRHGSSQCGTDAHSFVTASGGVQYQTAVWCTGSNEPSDPPVAAASCDGDCSAYSGVAGFHGLSMHVDSYTSPIGSPAVRSTSKYDKMAPFKPAHLEASGEAGVCVDFFNMKDGHVSFAGQNADAVGPFRVQIGNTELSRGAKVSFNTDYSPSPHRGPHSFDVHHCAHHQSGAWDWATSFDDTPWPVAPVFVLPGYAGPDAYDCVLSKLTVCFDPADACLGIHPTDPRCVHGSMDVDTGLDPAKYGPNHEWRDGALTVQAVPLVRNTMPCTVNALYSNGDHGVANPAGDWACLAFEWSVYWDLDYAEINAGSPGSCPMEGLIAARCDNACYSDGASYSDCLNTIFPNSEDPFPFSHYKDADVPHGCRAKPSPHLQCGRAECTKKCSSASQTAPCPANSHASGPCGGLGSSCTCDEGFNPANTCWAPGSASCSLPKQYICHYPPGNQNNKQTLHVASSAVPAHLAHGDTVGECSDAPPSGVSCQFATPQSKGLSLDFNAATYGVNPGESFTVSWELATSSGLSVPSHMCFWFFSGGWDTASSVATGNGPQFDYHNPAQRCLPTSGMSSGSVTISTPPNLDHNLFYTVKAEASDGPVPMSPYGPCWSYLKPVVINHVHEPQCDEQVVFCPDPSVCDPETVTHAFFKMDHVSMSHTDHGDGLGPHIEAKAAKAGAGAGAKASAQGNSALTQSIDISYCFMCQQGQNCHPADGCVNGCLEWKSNGKHHCHNTNGNGNHSPQKCGITSHSFDHQGFLSHVLCTAPTCSDSVQNGGEAGIDCGGNCPACATCSDNIENQGEAGVDCGGPCPDCPSCSDNTQNGDETGVDCGGPSCATCDAPPADPTCNDNNQNGDEAGVDCGGSNCPACPTCSDNNQNGDEAGIDCGGSNCPACATCTDNLENGDELGVDCGGLACAPCAATCVDQLHNGDEEGIDCGGSNCAACPTCFDSVNNGDETGVDCGGICGACTDCNNGVQDGDEEGLDCGGNCVACGSTTCTSTLSPSFGCNNNAWKMHICHSTASATNPYVTNCISPSAWHENGPGNKHGPGHNRGDYRGHCDAVMTCPAQCSGCWQPDHNCPNDFDKGTCHDPVGDYDAQNCVATKSGNTWTKASLHIWCGNDASVGNQGTVDADDFGDFTGVCVEDKAEQGKPFPVMTCHDSNTGNPLTLADVTGCDTDEDCPAPTVAGRTIKCYRLNEDYMFWFDTLQERCPIPDWDDALDFQPGPPACTDGSGNDAFRAHLLTYGLDQPCGTISSFIPGDHSCDAEETVAILEYQASGCDPHCHMAPDGTMSCPSPTCPRDAHHGVVLRENGAAHCTPDNGRPDCGTSVECEGGSLHLLEPGDFALAPGNGHLAGPADGNPNNLNIEVWFKSSLSFPASELSGGGYSHESQTLVFKADNYHLSLEGSVIGGKWGMRPRLSVRLSDCSSGTCVSGKERTLSAHLNTELDQAPALNWYPGFDQATWSIYDNTWHHLEAGYNSDRGIMWISHDSRVALLAYVGTGLSVGAPDTSTPSNTNQVNADLVVGNIVPAMDEPFFGLIDEVVCDYCGVPPLYCGDGIIQGDLGETCDDGDRVNGDGCDLNCVAESDPPCLVDISAPACKDVQDGMSVDQIDNNPALGANAIVVSLDVWLNMAITLVGTQPFDRTKYFDDQSGQQCGWRSDSSALATCGCPECALPDQGTEGTYPCHSGLLDPCTAVPAVRHSEQCLASGPYEGSLSATISITLSLEGVVAGLDALGSFALYVHKVAFNPIQFTQTNAVNLWIAETACKIDMPVEFECGGDNGCVEVTTIVCTHFVGYSTTPGKSDYGALHVMCKVPPTHLSVNMRHDNHQCSQLLDGGTPNSVLTPVPSPCCNSIDNSVPVAACNRDWVPASANNGVLSGTQLDWLFETPAEIPADNSIVAGVQSLRGHVRIQRADGTISAATPQAVPNTIYSANYNVSRALITALPPLSLPLSINFGYTSLGVVGGVDEAAEAIEAAVTRLAPSFPPPPPSGTPFVMNFKVESGAITMMNHAVLEVIAKVNAGTHKFDDLTSAWRFRMGGSNVYTPPLSDPGYGGCLHYPALDTYRANPDAMANPSAVAEWPTAYVGCDGVFTGSPFEIGSVVTFDLSWKMVKAGSSGKVQLMQSQITEPINDPNAQDVSISVNIELGASSTTVDLIDPSGAPAGGDNTMIYVGVGVAAAVVVSVAGLAGCCLCMRSATKEQDVVPIPVSPIYNPTLNALCAKGGQPTKTVPFASMPTAPAHVEAHAPAKLASDTYNPDGGQALPMNMDMDQMNQFQDV